MKKFLTLLLALALISTGVYAYELPHAFWEINRRYTEASDSGDLWGVINSGIETLNLLANEPENEQVLQVKASRLEKIAKSYETLGDFRTSAEYFGKYAVYAEKLGWDDAVKISKSKTMQYSDDIRIFKDSISPVSTYNARLEHDKGVLFGLPSDSPVKNNVQNRSMIILYHEFGDTSDSGWLELILKEAQQNGQALVFAWNIPGQGSQVPSVPYQKDYIISTLRLIEKYNSVPVYIRFGAEVNIWDNRADPAQFIQAFRTVANLARQHTSNTAMVWSMNVVSSWDIDMNDYYPGDEYVDWVGVSLYMQKYFLGRNNWAENEKFNEVVFFSGRNADPVKMLDEVVTKYGGRKPIMITESGSSHFVRTVNEHHSLWAQHHLSMLYNYVPMVYPQIKLIAHFDKVIPHEINDYALSTNSDMLTLYKNLVTLPHFIQNGKEDNSVAYTSLNYDYAKVSTTDDIYTYVHTYATENPTKVCYYIDGQWVGAATQMPYKFTGMSSVSEGNHVLTVAVEKDGCVVAEKSFNISVTNDISIIIGGKKIKTDTHPTIVGGRTLVPVRVVANGLGADVQWNAKTRTVTITRGSEHLTLTIDNTIMTKNGKNIELDTAPAIINNRTMVPIRAISEALNAYVNWDGATRSVVIN